MANKTGAHSCCPDESSKKELNEKWERIKEKSMNPKKPSWMK